MQAVRTLKPLLPPPSELETLFATHHARVFRTAQRITGSPADAEDVLQTVFLRLVKSGEYHDLSEHPEAYLSRAAINASLDLMRSRSRSKSVGLADVVADNLQSKSKGPEAREKPLGKCSCCVITKVTTTGRSRNCWALRRWLSA